MTEQDQSAGTAAIKECPKCSTKMKITAALRGKRIKCPGCSILLKISEDGEVSVPVMTTYINAKICPECSTRMRITENLHGKKIKCPKCTTLLQISEIGEISLVKSEVEEEPEDEQEDTQDQFVVEPPKKEELEQDEESEEEKTDFEEDDDDEQLTVGDEEDEQPTPSMHRDIPSFQLRPPEQEEEKPEEKTVRTEIPETTYMLKKDPTPKPKNNNLMYVVSIVAVVLIIFTLIELFTGFLHGSTPAVVSGEPEKPKTEYEITLDLANLSSDYFVEANNAKNNAEAWANEATRGEILAEYSNAVMNYLKATIKSYGLKPEENKAELSRILDNCQNAYISARFDADLYSVFADSVTMNKCQEMVAACENSDALIKYSMPILAANDKRNISLNLLNKWMENLADADAETQEKVHKFVQMVAMKYFVNTWETLNKYYEYMKYAKDNELTPNSLVMDKVRFIVEIEMGNVETQLTNLGVNVDRNLEAAADLRTNAEALMQEVGDYGKTE